MISFITLWATNIYLCSLNVYHEAQGEPLQGKIKVAQVTFNRTVQRKQSVQTVIYSHAQFSWTEDSRSDAVTDHKAMAGCVEATLMCLYERINGDIFNGANLYHAEEVDPWWAHKEGVVFLGKIGKHLFYKE